MTTLLVSASLKLEVTETFTFEKGNRIPFIMHLRIHFMLEKKIQKWFKLRVLFTERVGVFSFLLKLE